jgi:hypothetical protein
VGTTFWATRSIILKAWIPLDQSPTTVDLIKASSVAGGVTGGVMGALIRGRSNIFPGVLMFTLFGLSGQTAYDYFSRSRAATSQTTEHGFWRRMSEKSWSPVTVMTDQQYVELLNDKMLKVDVEIAITNDRIAALREEQQKKMEAQAQGNSTESKP